MNMEYFKYYRAYVAHVGSKYHVTSPEYESCFIGDDIDEALLFAMRINIDILKRIRDAAT